MRRCYCGYFHKKQKELADAIANSTELASLKEAEMKMMMDNEARAIVEEYQGNPDGCHEQRLKLRRFVGRRKETCGRIGSKNE